MKLLPSTNILDFEGARRALDQIVDHYNRVHETYGIIWLIAATTQVIANAATKITTYGAEEGEGVTVSYADGKLIVLTTGTYRIEGHVSIAAQAGSGNVTGQIWKNGTAIVPAASKVWIGNGEFGDLRMSTIGKLTAGDYIELYCLGGGSLTFDVAACSLQIKRLA